MAVIFSNMDEASSFLNIPLTKEKVKKGNRQIIMKAQSQEKYRNSVLIIIIIF